MPKAPFANLLQYLRHLYPADAGGNSADSELLDRFIRAQDEEAFTAIVQRHASMVLGVCQRLLGDRHLAEDSFQATFIVLARRAKAIRSRTSLGTWLYAVAQRVALKARAKTTAWRIRERQSSIMAGREPIDEHTWQELRSILDEEVARLPEKYQAPLVLCYLESKSHDRAAKELGCAKTTLERRLSRGRELLRKQLIRRGATLSAGALATALGEKSMAATVGVSLVIKTAQAAVGVAAGKGVAVGCLTARAVALAEEAMAGVSALSGKLVGIVLAIGVIVGGVGWAGYKTLAETSRLYPTAVSRDAQRSADSSPRQEMKLDQYGDALPEGAVMRLGTMRLRHEWGVESIAFTPKGNQVVSAGGHRIRVWETATGKEVRRLDAINLMELTISSTGRVLAAAQNGSVSTWDLPTWKPKFSHAVTTFAVAISPDGSVLASGGRAGSADPITLWNMQTGNKLRSLAGKMTQVARLAFSPDGQALAAASCLKAGWSLKGSRPEIVRIWDLATGQLHELVGHTGGVTSLAYAPDGSVIATGGHDGNICLWDTATRKLRRKIKLVEEPYFHRNGNGIDSGGILGSDNGGILALAFAPNGQTMASANYDGTVRLWEVGTGKQLRILRGHAFSVGSVAFSPDGKILASGSNDQTIRLWDPATGALLNPHQGHDGRIGSVLIYPDGKRAASAGDDRTIRFWDLTKGQELSTLRDLKSAIHSVSLSPDGHTLAAGLEDGSIHLRDADSGAELSVLKGHKGQVQSVSFSPDGKLLASASPSGENSNLARKETVRSLRLWDLNTGHELPRIEGTRNDEFARFSSDGKWLTAFIFPGGVDLWEPATGKKQRRLGDLQDFAFLPDGKMIAGWSPAPRRFGIGGGFSSEKGMVRVRRIADGGEVYSFDGPERRPIIGGVFVVSPDGRLLALAVSEAGKYDQEVVQLWEMATGKLRRTLKGHGGTVSACAFSPNGRMLLSAGSDSTLLVWDLALPREQRPQELTQKALTSLWGDLGDADAARADQAIWGLVGAPQQTLPFLQKSLSATPAPDPAWLVALVKELGSEQFTNRDKATRALEGLEELAYPILNKALAGPVTLETRRRIEHLLIRLKTPLNSPKKIREVRAVEVLERIGSSEAKAVLESLARGAPGARETEEAKASLLRLSSTQFNEAVRS